MLEEHSEDSCGDNDANLGKMGGKRKEIREVEANGISGHTC